jgi:transcriptional regulator with XRE-family HTH domain
MYVLMRDLGQRLEDYRISRNIKQDDLAKTAGLSRTTIGKLEAGGGGTIETLLRVLRAFDLEGRILQIVPDTSINPLDPISTQGKKRQRARSVEDEQEPWTWGDTENDRGESE